MFYGVDSLRLLQEHLDSGGFLNIFNNYPFTILHSFVSSAMSFFVISVILSALYRKKVLVVRYALTSVMFCVLTMGPTFLVNFLRPESITYHYEDWFVIYPPYFLPLLYALCVFMLGIDRSISLSTSIKLYTVAVSNILVYYMAEAAAFHFATNDVRYIFTVMFLANGFMMVLNTAACALCVRVFRRRKVWLDAYKLKRTINVNIRGKLLHYTGIAALLHAGNCLMMTLLARSGQFLLTELVLFVLVVQCLFIFWVSYNSDRRTILRADIHNQSLHIRSLVGSIDDMRGLRHDLTNMVQVYQGFIDMSDWDGLSKYHASLMQQTRLVSDYLDLGTKFQVHPVILSLLHIKADLAQRCGVMININIASDSLDIRMDELDLSRVVGNLLDNAIEEAAQTEIKSIQFSLQPAGRTQLLLSITNPTTGDVDVNAIMEKGFTKKNGHGGLGLYTLWNLVNRTQGCRVRAEYLNRMITFYLELPCRGREGSDGIA